jgi:hypothetical protein
MGVFTLIAALSQALWVLNVPPSTSMKVPPSAVAMTHARIIHILRTPLMLRLKVHINMLSKSRQVSLLSKGIVVHT